MLQQIQDNLSVAFNCIQSSWMIISLISGSIGIVMIIIGIILYLKSKWVESDPNEWLLVIRNGELLRAGVGMKTFIGFFDSFVKFPSKIQRVSFNANNVTKQMQGVIITGFAFWSVYRQKDGPFRCYKYMQSGQANDNVQAMCQSILRNLIANSSLDDVMKKRNHLLNNLKNDLKNQFQGWGVWLETIEITQVTISSSNLFQELQAQFRMQTQLKAQEIELKNSQKLKTNKLNSDFKMTQINELNTTKKLQSSNDQKIKRQQQQVLYHTNRKNIEIEKIQREMQYELEKLNNQVKKTKERLNNQNQLKKKENQFQLKSVKKQLQCDRMLDQNALKKYQIDVSERIYKRLAIKEVKINQFVGDQKESIAALMPHLGYSMGELKTIQ